MTSLSCLTWCIGVGSFITRPIRKPISVIGLIALLAVSACIDDRQVAAPDDAPASALSSAQPDLQVLTLQNMASSHGPGRTIRDELADVARRVPGGFGGVFFDEDGILTILLVDPSLQTPAKAALAGERFLQVRQNSPGGERFALAEARIRQGTYAYDELYDWYGRVLRALPITARRSSIRVHRNRIAIGIGEESQRAIVERAIEESQVPPEAVIIEYVPPSVPLQALTDPARPVPGGFQIRYNASQNPACTIGPNVRWVTPGKTERAFLVASHCSKDPFQFNAGNITHYWQPAQFGPFPGFHIGNKALDPPLFPCVEDVNGCRNSDAALAAYASYAPYELGTIGRTVGRNTPSLQIDPAQPRFQIVSTMDWSTDGEILEKVGRTTGWTGGQVFDSCVTYPANPPNFPPYSIRCAMIILAESGGGDSGAPVFRIVGDGQIELRGTAFHAHGSCYLGPDPVDPQLVHYGPGFVASNLGGIQMDHDPLITGAFNFW